MELRRMVFGLVMLAALVSFGCGALDEIDPECKVAPGLDGFDSSVVVGRWHGGGGASLALNADLTFTMNLPRTAFATTGNGTVRKDLVGDGTWRPSPAFPSMVELTYGSNITTIVHVSGSASDPVLWYHDSDDGCQHNTLTREGPAAVGLERDGTPIQRRR